MSDRTFGAFGPREYQAIIRSEADALVAALEDAPLTARVPACPDWDIADLVTHLGTVHEWAARCLSSDPDGGRPPFADLRPEGSLAAWYAGHAGALLEALAATDPAAPCWTLHPGHRGAGFWSRRQSHETAMHRNDLVAALGQEYSYPDAHAADGVAEVMEVFLHRRRTYKVPPLDVPAPVLIECTDRPDRWLLTPVPERPDWHQATGPAPSPEHVDSAAAVLRGRAACLLFTFWRRQDADAAGLTADGDTTLVDRLLSARLTP